MGLRDRWCQPLKLQLMSAVQREGQINAVLFPCLYVIVHKPSFIIVFLTSHDSEAGLTRMVPPLQRHHLKKGKRMP